MLGYRTVQNSKSIHSKENSLLDSLGKKNQFLVHGFKISQRSYLGDGNYIDYDAKAVSEQVQALKDNV